MTIWNSWIVPWICSRGTRTQDAGTPQNGKQRPIPPSGRFILADRFVSMSVGGTLVLKACGFIEDQQARILNVTESSLRVRTGHEWYERLLSGRRRRKPMEVVLEIHPLMDQDDPARASSPFPDRYCVIEARIVAGSRSWSQAEFAEESRRLLWRLRSCFMAC